MEKNGGLQMLSLQNVNLCLVMGKSNPENPRHTQHSTIIVPTDAEGFTITRALRSLGELHSPGGEGDVVFKNVRVPVSNLILR